MFGESPAGIVNTMTCRDFLLSGLIAEAAEGKGSACIKMPGRLAMQGRHHPVYSWQAQPLFTGKVDF